MSELSETVIVTGGSRGIGKAVARRFLERGARVISLARTACPLEGVRSLLVDLAAPDFEQTIGALLEAEIPLPARIYLVHNASLYGRDSVSSASAERLRALLEVALVAPSVLNRLLLPRMARGSAIIYLGSTLSEKAIAGSLSYVVAKHGVIGLMRATCQDLLGTGVHTACVCPGFTDTEMLRSRIGDDPAALPDLVAMTGERRLIDPAEIASLIEYAAQSSVLNGAVLHANLGQREH